MDSFKEYYYQKELQEGIWGGIKALGKSPIAFTQHHAQATE